MVSASADTLIQRLPEPVFEFVAVNFFTNYQRWSPEVQCLEVLSPGPIGVGSQARQVRIDKGRHTDTTFAVVTFEEPHCLEFAECGNRYRIGYRLEPAGEYTRLTFAIELIRLDLVLRPFKKLIAEAIQAGAERTVCNIKQLVELEVPG